MKVRCIDADFGGSLTVGNVYEAEDDGWVVTADGEAWSPSRFEPVPDEPEEPASTLDPEVIRVINEAFKHVAPPVEQPGCPSCNHIVGYNGACMGCGWSSEDAPAEQPKVDPYEEHRRRWDESGSAAVLMRGFDGLTDATARLLRGLEGEKVRGRVRAFPKQGRNFELRGKR